MAKYPKTLVKAKQMAKTARREIDDEETLGEFLGKYLGLAKVLEDGSESREQPEPST